MRYIEVDTLKNDIQKARNDFGILGNSVETYFNRLVSAQPTADVKPIVRGEWIYQYTNGFGRKIFKCSKCGNSFDSLGWIYCPNCGVEMKEAEE